MFSNFDSGKGILTINKVPIKYAGTVYEKSDQWKSYMQYVNNGLAKDIKELLIPELDAIAKAEGSDIDYLRLGSCEVLWDNTADYLGNEYYAAFVTFYSTRILDKSAKFCIFKLPYMDEYGVLTRDKKKYAIISELVQGDDITYNRNKSNNKGELKVITAGGCYINMKGSAYKPKMTFRKKDIDAYSVVAALAEDEGIDALGLYDKLVSTSAAKAFRDSTQKMMKAIYSGGMTNIRDYIAAMKSPRYDLSIVRDKVNRVLSIDRAIGYNLATDVKLKSGEVIPSETMISKNTLKKLKLSAVNEVMVVDVPIMHGFYLAKSITLHLLRRGTELIPEVREFFPDEKGNYLNRDVRCKEGDGFLVRFEKGTVIRKGMLEMLAYNGVDEVVLKQNLNSTTFMEVPLVRSIVGNNCFTKRELGLSDSGEYVYIKSDGTYETPSNYITAYDVIAMISLYAQLEVGKDEEIIAGRDAGLRKKVNMANELFHKAFEDAVPKFIRRMRRSLTNMLRCSPQDLLNADEMEAKFFILADLWWKALYGKMKVIARIDKSNPLSFYSSFSKINTIVSDKNSISREQHSISMGHYGRLCPYETPSGKTMGVVNNRAIGLKIENGIMKTGYHPIKHIGDLSYVDFSIVKYLSVEEEENYRIADIMSLDFDVETGKIENTGRVIARVPNRTQLEKMDVQHVDISKIDFVNIDPNQTDGIVAITVPFQGADDSARIIFGLSMAKQAKPCHRAEIPIIMTSAYYNIPRKSPYFMVQAEYDGIVIEAYDTCVAVEYVNGKVTQYNFKSQEFSKESIIIREVLVQVGDEVKAGDIMVTSNFIKDGYLATGVNVLVAYVPEGYNYEDGVFGSIRLSEKLVSYGSSVDVKRISNKYRSNHIEYADNFKYREKGSQVFKMRQQLGSEVVYNPVVSKNIKGFLVSTRFEQPKERGECISVVAEAVSFDKVHCGDKVANRHGNKGVTPILCDNNEMPQFKNGEFVDLAFNPLGVPSRMNIGQILECNLGLAGYILGIRINSDAFNGATIEEVKLLLSYAWDLANLDDVDGVFNAEQYKGLPEALHVWCKGRLQAIRFWKGAFNKDGTAWLYNPKTDKFFETPVLVGINYVYKLIHVADKKVHGRGGLCTEPYVTKLSAPPKGSSKQGGQRMGHMEFNAFAGLGATAWMHELLNERSDNYVARNNLTVDVLHSGSESFQLDGETGIKRSTEYFVALMEALGCKIDFEGELPNNTKDEIERRVCYKRDALIKATDLDESKEIVSLREFASEIGSIK